MVAHFRYLVKLELGAKNGFQLKR
ncbi:MAG: hypothetical protein RIR63_368, partial [Actinomycetota bacterium]